MQIFNKKTIEAIQKSDDFDFEKLPSDMKERLWSAVRKNDKSAIDDLIEKIGAQKYSLLEKAVKDENEEYYKLTFFRDEKNPVFIRRALFEEIYNDFVVVSCYEEALKKVKEYIDEDDMLSLAFICHNVTDFCLERNRTGSEAVKILVENYDLEKEVVEGVEDIFNKNKISLKLDYIIANMVVKKDN